MKRSFDILVSLITLIILLPVFVIIALAIKLDSKGDVFFLQERVGRGRQTFGIYKFRSMVSGADQQGPYFTSKNDARITKVGAFLRKTSLDELPQFINVLKGDMSIVGPRPDVPKMESLYTPEQWQERHLVRPGITGLAQATLRSSSTMEQRTAMDLEYVSKHSLWFDLKILLLTVKQVLFKGSH